MSETEIGVLVHHQAIMGDELYDFMRAQIMYEINRDT
jgi:hypothetical protein